MNHDVKVSYEVHLACARIRAHVVGDPKLGGRRQNLADLRKALEDLLAASNSEWPRAQDALECLKTNDIGRLETIFPQMDLDPFDVLGKVTEKNDLAQAIPVPTKTGIKDRFR